MVSPSMKSPMLKGILRRMAWMETIVTIVTVVAQRRLRTVNKEIIVYALVLLVIVSF